MKLIFNILFLLWSLVLKCRNTQGNLFLLEEIVFKYYYVVMLILFISKHSKDIELLFRMYEAQQDEICSLYLLNVIKNIYSNGIMESNPMLLKSNLVQV